jgi:Ser/Thr protein kinase RdoA (MazF antagonist)
MRGDVPTLIDLNIAPLALSRWDARAGTLQPVSRGDNFVYRFRNARGQERYLRIASPNYRPRDQIEAELDFVRHLHGQKVPVAPPVRSRRRRWLETIDTPQGEMYAAVFEAVAGEQTSWGSDAHNRKMLFERGKALGRMHRAAMTYRRKAKCTRFHWYEDDLFTDPLRYLRKNDTVARREYEALIQWMLDRPATRENYGIVHGDFGSGNTRRRKDGSLAAFDFDDCCYHWYIYDLAVAIRSAATRPLQVRKRYLCVLMEGYATEKDLGADTADDVAQYCRLAAFYRYIAVLRTCDRRRMTREQRELFNNRLATLRRPPRWT